MHGGGGGWQARRGAGGWSCAGGAMPICWNKLFNYRHLPIVMSQFALGEKLVEKMQAGGIDETASSRKMATPSGDGRRAVTGPNDRRQTYD